MEHHSAILNLPDEITIGQYADHRNIVRFESISDRNFRPVLSRLKRFEEDIVKGLHLNSPHFLQPVQSVQKGKSNALCPTLTDKIQNLLSHWTSRFSLAHPSMGEVMF